MQPPVSLAAYLTGENPVPKTKAKPWPLSRVAAFAPAAIQQLGHANYALYETAHELAHLWFSAKIFSLGLPLYLYPGDFWATMQHRTQGKFCGDCHSRLYPDKLPCEAADEGAAAVYDYFYSNGGWPWAQRKRVAISRCRQCFYSKNTRECVIFLISLSRNASLGALLSVRPLAIRIVNFLLFEYADSIWCHVCEVWVRGREKGRDHFSEKRHRNKAAKASARMDGAWELVGDDRSTAQRSPSAVSVAPIPQTITDQADLTGRRPVLGPHALPVHVH